MKFSVTCRTVGSIGRSAVLLLPLALLACSDGPTAGSMVGGNTDAGSTPEIGAATLTTGIQSSDQLAVALRSDATYQWQVRALNESGAGPWTMGEEFQMPSLVTAFDEGSPGVDAQPRYRTLMNDESELKHVSWGAIADAEAYEVALNNVQLGVWAGREVFPVEDVCSSDGCGINVTTPVVRMNNLDPLARMSIENVTGITTDVFTFDGSASDDPDGLVTNYVWEVDGQFHQFANASVIEHSFSLPGDYTIRLTVIDDAGGSSTVTALVNISPANDETEDVEVASEPGAVEIAVASPREIALALARPSSLARPEVASTEVASTEVAAVVPNPFAPSPEAANPVVEQTVVPEVVPILVPPEESGDGDPVVTSDPDPVVTSDPDPVVTVDPNPIETPNPDPVETVDPDPVETVDPNPVETTDPDPVVTAEPDPVESVDPDPVVTAETDPVETGEPDPADSIDPGTDESIQAFEFTSIEIGEITDNLVRVEFSLSDFGAAEIHYGTAEDDLTGRNTGETSFDYQAHIQRIDDLAPETTYYFQVHSVNEAGVQIVSEMQSFTTAEEQSVDSGFDPGSETFTPTIDGWPTNADENLPMSGVFYGTSHGGLQTGNTRIAVEHSLRFRAEKTGHIQSLRWENRRLTQGNVDFRTGAVYDTCRDNNVSPEVCAYMLGNPYSVGNGGQILATIHPDDGNGIPNESVTLGEVDEIYRPSDYPHGVWITQNFTSPVAVVAGGLYHVKLRNLAPPRGRFTSNTLAEARAHDPNTGAMGLNGVWHGSLVGPDSLKWGPYYGRMGQEALYRNATSGSWQETPVTFGWLQFRYADGVWTGASSTGYDNIQTPTPYSTSAYEGAKVVQGGTRARQVFTVQTADRVINGMWLNFGHARNATVSPLTVELKNADGTVIASGSIAGNSEVVSRVNAGYGTGNLNEINVRTWGYTDLPETRLQTGSTYYLELSAGNNAGFHINSIFNLQENRNDWTDAYAQVRRNSGAAWGVYSAANGRAGRDLPIMFTLQGMPKRLP